MLPVEAMQLSTKIRKRHKVSPDTDRYTVTALQYKTDDPIGQKKILYYIFIYIYIYKYIV